MKKMVLIALFAVFYVATGSIIASAKIAVPARKVANQRRPHKNIRKNTNQLDEKILSSSGLVQHTLAVQVALGNSIPAIAEPKEYKKQVTFNQKSPKNQKFPKQKSNNIYQPVSRR